MRRVSQIEKGVGVGVKDDDEKLMSFGEEGGADAPEDDQWVATHFDDQQTGSSSQVADMLDIPDIGEDQLAPEHQLTEGQQDDLAARVAGVTIGHQSDSIHASASGDGMGDIDDIPDIPDMDDETDELAAGVHEDEDPATAAPPTHNASRTGWASAGDNGKLLSVRKYDCIITYDKYYQTPRMWLVGYDEHGVPLKPAQIFEDVSSDYAQKTVTIEPFPHGHAGPDSSVTSSASAVGVATASIHPCKHASVMKKVIERMNASVIEEQRRAAACSGTASVAGEKKKKKGWSVSSAVKRVTGGATDGSSAPTAEAKEDGSTTAEAAATEAEDDVDGLRVDQYMIIFLKFMASIVPAIEIDATQAL